MSDVKMYVTHWCSHCRSAKRLLEEQGVVYHEIDIEQLGLSRQALAKLTGGYTVPQIVINGETIGGFDELYHLVQSGEMGKYLRKDYLEEKAS